LFSAAGDGGLVWATASATGTAAFTVTATASLPQGATGKPMKLRAFGSVVGYAQVQIGNAQVIQVPVVPNYDKEAAIPDRAFPGPVNGLTVVIVGLAAGTNVALVGFRQ
jgi:hypothetical protein